MTHPPSSSRRAIGTPGKADDFAVALSFPRLMQQLQQQHKHYSRLLAQSQRVTELLASQRSEDLPALMEERQKVIDELQRIDKDLAGYRLHWIEWFPRLEKNQRQEVTALTRELENLRKQLSESDKVHADRLRQESQRLGKELGMLGRASQVTQLYRGQQQVNRMSTMYQTDRQV